MLLVCISGRQWVHVPEPSRTFSEWGPRLESEMVAGRSSAGSAHRGCVWLVLQDLSGLVGRSPTLKAGVAVAWAFPLGCRFPREEEVICVSSSGSPDNPSGSENDLLAP